MEIKTKDSLKKFLEKEISACKGLVIIQAGHFALVFSEDKKQLVPGIYQDVFNKEQKEAIKLHPYMGDFPLKTWEIGVELLDFARKNKKEFGMVIIVNDWQWVQTTEKGKANTLRADFYKNADLPESYKNVLAKYSFDSKVILPMKREDEIIQKLFFSEKKLRNLFSRKLAKICELGEHKCAQEYVPLLNQIIKQNAKLFISFVPRTCMIPINTGSEEIKNKLKSDIKIINIFASGISKDFFKDIQISIF